ncbi:MAG: HD domain-containing phosphohydrolase [Clostridia bacterium]
MIENNLLIIIPSVIIATALLLFIISKRLEMRRSKSTDTKFKSIVTSMKQGLAVHKIIIDKDKNPVDYKFLYVNKQFEQSTGLKASKIIGKSVLQIMPQTEKYWIEKFGEVALEGTEMHFEEYEQETDRYFDVVAYSNEPMQFVTVVTDVTDRKRSLEEIKRQYYHDEMTGLFNRKYINEIIKGEWFKENLPVSVIIGDINGLKIMNNAFGRNSGDEFIVKVGHSIIKACRQSDIIARTGGDEFMILLPKTSLEITEKIISRTKSFLQDGTDLDAILSISFGWAEINSEEQNIEQLFSEAEELMLKNKTFEGESFRGQTINIVLNTLHEKNKREEQHSKRVSKFCVEIGKAMNFSETDINKLRVIGLLHDIGKIGVSEHILNKPGRLDLEEWLAIKKHSEIGYRILSSTKETSELAQYVLSHHEKIDGTGYPNSLSGESISVMTRILSIADAYDAMTSKRTYNDGISREAAIEELRAHAGGQFDPRIIDIFINEVLAMNVDI